jgi:asparagine synthase (glutamine-hydrolysing)
MCGIAGIAALGSRPAPVDLEERLAAMATAMYHRGPDDGGLRLSSGRRVGLANRRLAIRDLSSAGSMPMANSDATLLLTYNGEIYNAHELRADLEGQGYQFRSHSDTEVVLHGYAAWGEAVVQRLRGIFAFAVWDQRPQLADAGRLFLARDRLGVKPLYFARTGSAFVFASELTALLSSGLVSADVGSAGLVGYLMLGAVPNPLTIYRNVRALEPGCTLTVTPGTGQERKTRYWSLPQRTKSARIDHHEAVTLVRAALDEAVRLELVSDVPIGAFLSGGLDSSAVVALIRSATDGPVLTCSMIFEEAEYSEAPYARAMAEAAGSKHYERVITARDVELEMDAILRAMDQPTVDGVNTYFVSQTARQAGLTVALSGLGGDELFGGYGNTFRGTPHMLRAVRQAHAVPGAATLAARLIDMSAGRHRWAKVKDALVRPPSAASAYLVRRGLFSPREVQALVEPEVWQEATEQFDAVAHIAERAGDRARGTRVSMFDWVSRAELGTYTHHQLLRDTDVMSMAHSLEVRVPLLDHKLVELVLGLPATVKMAGTGPKPLMVSAVGDRLPEAVRTRRGKQGFTFPFDRWLRGPLRDSFGAAPDRQSGFAQLLRQDEVARVMQAYQAGKLHWSRPWALTVLQGWLHTARARRSSYARGMNRGYREPS